MAARNRVAPIERVPEQILSMRGRPRKYPFNQLEPPIEENGEKLYSSFFVPGKMPSQIYPAWRYWRDTYAKDSGMEVRLKHTIDERGRPGTRVIRVK